MPDDDAHALRQRAADAFNEAWRYRERASRSPEEERKMLELAHESREAWAIAGTPRNWARSEWQLSRVYATIGRPEIALRHAALGLHIANQNDLGDFDLATGYEAFVRIYQIVGNLESARREFVHAMSHAAQVVEPEDRAVLFMELREHAQVLGMPWDEH